jgi:hypothetical protein
MLHMPIEGERDLKVTFEDERRNFEETPSARIVTKVRRSASFARFACHGSYGLKERTSSFQLLWGPLVRLDSKIIMSHTWYCPR